MSKRKLVELEYFQSDNLEEKNFQLSKTPNRFYQKLPKFRYMGDGLLQHACPRNWVLTFNIGPYYPLGIIDADYRGEILPFNEITPRYKHIYTYLPISHINTASMGDAGRNVLVENCRIKNGFPIVTIAKDQAKALEPVLEDLVTKTAFLVVPRSSTYIRYDLALHHELILDLKHLDGLELGNIDKQKIDPRDCLIVNKYAVQVIRFKYEREYNFKLDISLKPNQIKKIDLKLSPLYIFLKAGVFLHKRVIILDNFSHTGCVLLKNLSSEKVRLNEKDFTCLVPINVTHPNFIHPVKIFPNTERGTRGFGSTDEREIIETEKSGQLIELEDDSSGVETFSIMELEDVPQIGSEVEVATSTHEKEDELVIIDVVGESETFLCFGCFLCSCGKTVQKECTICGVVAGPNVDAHNSICSCCGHYSGDAQCDCTHHEATMEEKMMWSTKLLGEMSE